MRKLTVKNFSVIKDAELEFGKITVLIGPQASGKSLLCKLAFFFAQRIPEIDYSALTFHQSFDEFRKQLTREFVDSFPVAAWKEQVFEITYQSVQFDVVIDGAEKFPKIRFNQGFEDRYIHFNEPAPEGYGRMNAIDPRWIDERVEYGPLRLEESVYIPASRALFSSANEGFRSLFGTNPDWITKRFSTAMDFDYKALINSFMPGDSVLHAFGQESGRILRGRVVDPEGSPRFQQASNERILPFELLSSGTLELLPLLNPLAIKASKAKYPNIPTQPEPRFGMVYMEEPESGIFPNTQYLLVRLFAWLAKEPTLNLSLVITTHSPYLLSSFNNLIEAGQVVKDHPELHREVAKAVPERYWIKDGDLKAYSIQDGKLESIISDVGMIGANYLDQISEVIGSEFDDLLRLEYDNTKA